MVPGFNHNIKYKEKIYHVQTEDSGLKNPNIVSHVFLGGNILASRRVNYQDICANENVAEIVRQMMKDLHKEMVKALISGSIDEKIPSETPPPPPQNPIPITHKVSGDGTIDGDKARNSEKSLDEIILDYLSKDSR